MDKPADGFLDKIAPDRRQFVKRILGMAGFAVPAVRSFVMATVVAQTANAMQVPGAEPTPCTGTDCPETTTTTTTTPRPWRSPIPGNPGLS